MFCRSWQFIFYEIIKTHKTVLKDVEKVETRNNKKINRKIRGAVRNIYLLFNKKITFIMAVGEWEEEGKLKNWFSLLRSLRLCLTPSQFSLCDTKRLFLLTVTNFTLKMCAYFAMIYLVNDWKLCRKFSIFRNFGPILEWWSKAAKKSCLRMRKEPKIFNQMKFLPSNFSSFLSATEKVKIFLPIKDKIEN